MRKASIGFKVLDIFFKALIIIFSVSPIYACIIVSLTPYSNLLSPQLFPHYFDIGNYAAAFKNIAPYMLNSFLYAIMTICFTLFVSIPVAYICARYNFKGKSPVVFGLLLTQMISGIVLLPSLYSIYNNFDLLDNRFSLVFTFTGVNIALTVMLLMGFFKTIPYAIEEAAYIDGINFTMLLVRIIVPISLPAIAVSAIFTFINSYNEFVIPLFLLTSPEIKTLTLRLYSYMSDTTVLWNIVGAAALIGMLPPVLIFMFFQKYIISGITSGAVKG
ncbi:MAG TPA: carbohydrate ABC transporter permease [Clostridia bacterium]